MDVLPCPFCGHEPAVVFREGPPGESGHWGVACEDDDCIARPDLPDAYPTPLSALVAWNAALASTRRRRRTGTALSIERMS